MQRAALLAWGPPPASVMATINLGCALQADGGVACLHGASSCHRLRQLLGFRADLPLVNYRSAKSGIKMETAGEIIAWFAQSDAPLLEPCSAALRGIAASVASASGAAAPPAPER